MPETALALAAEQLVVETARGVPIVDGVDVSTARGRLLALVGESGCGKTSTALALLGHARSGTRIAGGRVAIDGREILALAPEPLRRLRGRVISYVPQDPGASLNPRMRIGTQLHEMLAVHGLGGEARARIRELLERVQLPATDAFTRRYPFELSGGQQQRVAIAKALSARPSVVVFDEPTTGLDVTTQARVLELVRELRDSEAAAFVYVTHDLAVVAEIADDVAVMYAGQILERGSRDDVMNTPAHPYTRLLLSSVPRIKVRRLVNGIPGAAPPPGSRPAGCVFAPRCPIAIEQCLDEVPPVVALSDTQSAACWRVEESRVSVEAVPHAVPDRSGAKSFQAPLVSLEEITASYGRGRRTNAVVHGVSLSIAPGTCVALVGESGSGKSTLGRCVAGIHPAFTGRILVDGGEIPHAAADRSQGHRRAIQIVFQNPERSLNPAVTIASTLERPLRVFGHLSGAELRSACGRLLDQVRLPQSMLYRFPRELSGGEKQRVAIARALAAEPRLIICDEITSALDVSIQATIIALLEELRESGLALLFITHNLGVVRSIADHVVVMKDGSVREEGATAAVIENPTDAYTRELLAAAPDMA